MSSINDSIWKQLDEAEQADLLAMYAARNPAATTLLSVESFADLVAQDFPLQKFLVDGLIPAGQLVMLGGRGKAGKSWLVLQLVAAVDQGLPFLGKTTTRGKVLYLALEDGRRRLNQRPKILKWQPSPAVDIAFKIDKFDAGGQGLAHIRQAIAEKGYDLVVVDTLVKTLSGSADENNNTYMAAICNDLADMAHDSGAAILIVHHTSKQLVENPFDALRGASAIRDAYDLGMMLVRKHGEKEATLYAESRDFDMQDVTIRQVEGGAGWEYVGDAAAGIAIKAGRVGRDIVMLHGEGFTADELAALTSKTTQAVRASMKTAIKHDLVEARRQQAGDSRQWCDHYFLTAEGKNP
jgi:KaiC/GvpD/RAD55 family RecA-like ATPase